MPRLESGLRRFRNLVPDRLSESLRDLAVRLAVPSARPEDRQSTERLTLAGLLTSPSGLGEGARLVAEGLADIGRDVGLIDVTPRLRLPAGTAAPACRDNLQYRDIGGPLLVHLNPPDFQKAVLLCRLARRPDRRIAYWFWELGIVPPVWRKAFRLVHEIWVPTHFVADALVSSGWRGTLRIVPPPLRMPPPQPQPPRRTHRHVLRVLTVFAYDSGFNRKNPLAAVAAFRQAFGDRDDVELVVKLRGHSRSGEPERQFAAAIAPARNLRVVDATLDRAAYLELLRSADVILSMHRSEGLGLPLAEAMLMGKPVVATGWSGNLDFMSDDSACLVPARIIPAHDEDGRLAALHAAWADPSVDAAADWLRRLQDPVLRAEIGARGRNRVMTALGLPAFRAAMSPR